MKEIAYNLLRALGLSFSFLLPLKLFTLVNHCRSVIYTGWVSGHFKKIGSNVLLNHGSQWVGRNCIVLGNNVSIGACSTITAWSAYHKQVFMPEISIEDECNIGEYCHISCISKVKIGKGVLAGRWLTVVDNFHGNVKSEDLISFPASRPLFSKGDVIIKDGVWIGDKVTILPGVTIGSNCIIGANSVVTKSFPDRSVIGGNPANLIRSL